MTDSTIEVVQGDITRQDVDAIVNAANNHLWMGAGTAGAIVRAGGREIEDEAIRQGPIEVGEAVVTGSGNLVCKHVIHAAAMGQDLFTSADKIRASTDNALKRAEELGIASIAFPALGTGGRRVRLRAGGGDHAERLLRALGRRPQRAHDPLRALRPARVRGV